MADHLKLSLSTHKHTQREQVEGSRIALMLTLKGDFPVPLAWCGIPQQGTNKKRYHWDRNRSNTVSDKMSVIKWVM
eukprot:3147012-Amphidinium_carterae.1